MENKIVRKTFVVMMAAAMCITTACSTLELVSDNGGGAQNNVETARVADEEGSAEKESSAAGTESSSKTENAAESQSFAEAHDAFQTTLAEQNNDDDPIPDPPEGVFDLVHYSSKVGDLAAYVSSDPGDGEKHPLIIWVVGGWGNGIDDFPWCYPAWDDDQTGSAFWQAGVLTMYPSFRGGNGNPGYYETLFGEVDDLAAAYDYAASLPYVDPDRIYLGGHSTGGTRALLTAEYTDKFRAVFGFGAVDKIEYHNNSQFTFDTDNEEEYKMRSPIYWLDSVKTPTFLIEGSEGNSSNLKSIESTSQNDNIHCYIMEGEDHWSVLAPLTRVIAQKILADTGEECNIAITQEELDEAMKQDPVIPLPVMQQCTMEDLGINFSYPYLWNMEDISENGEVSYMLVSRYEEDNIWDMSMLLFDAYMPEEGVDLQLAKESYEADGCDVEDITIGGFPAMRVESLMETESSNIFQTTFVGIQKDDILITFEYFIHEDFGDDADPLFDAIIESIAFAQ
ncbi:MAG: prolyl oligopeptidase family serine peptidase [Lachnospiraceae bacterium]|nr:prolyl oligopeptidase family serine peptidase [Lachnospiraceae bacterium]